MFAPSPSDRPEVQESLAVATPAVPQPRSRRAVRYFANGLMGLGLLLLVLGAGSYGYSFLMEQQVRSDPWLAELEARWQQVQSTVATNPINTPGGLLGLGGAKETPTTATAPTSTVAPTPTQRVYPPAVGIKIPSIDVESRVVQVGIKDGEYEVPRFYVGHYDNTANPGEGSNGVYSGHVESLSSGNVFANLPEIAEGDEVLLFTEEGIWRYKVREIKTVPNDDLSVMAKTEEEVVTLITCTGTFDPAERQYTHRLVVVAEPTGGDRPEKPAADAR